MVIEISNKTQYEEEVTNSKDLVVIDFWAPWCGPCKSYKPIFEKTAEDGLEGVKFVSIDIDQEEVEDIVDEFGISGVPLTAVVKDGEVITERPGMMMKDQLIEFIEQSKK